MRSLSLEMVEGARRALQKVAVRTPIEPSEGLERITGVPVYLKMECFQKTGSFKVRGAYCFLASLSAAERKRGVIAASAGNHGKAVAYAASLLQIKAEIFVPKGADRAKVAAIRHLGHAVTVTEFAGYDDTEAYAKEVALTKGALFVPAFDDPLIMAGNGGTLAMEVLEDLPEAASFFLPVGGGGLSAGFSFVSKSLKQCRIIGCQLKASPALKLSLDKGVAHTKLPAAETLAGGLEGGIGASCFDVLKTRVDDVFLSSEQGVAGAVRWMAENHSIVIEPSSAVVIDALLGGRWELNGPALLVVSGRNVSWDTVTNIL